MSSSPASPPFTNVDAVRPSSLTPSTMRASRFHSPITTPSAVVVSSLDAVIEPYTHDSDGCRLTWNAMVGFIMPAGVVVSIGTLLRDERAFGDRDIGLIHITLSELLPDAPDGRVPGNFDAFRGCKIESGKPHGAAVNCMQ
ncbi:protein SRC2-like [Hordeum vulgare]|nr:protein SRC2-like [Hordeum vulgare]